MYDTEHNLRVVARTAELTASDGGDTDDRVWRFGGVAVGEGDILYTDDGTPVLFLEGVLAESAHTQAGQPLSKDHPEDENGRPTYPPPVDETAGKVEKAGYVPGQGLVYEAVTHDETIANGVKAGSFDVSVHPVFDLSDEKDPDTGAYIPKNVEFLDLATVSRGMSPSNTAEWGPNHALASWTRQADIGAEIEAAGMPDDPDEPPGWFQRWTAKVGITADASGDDEQEPESDESAESDTGEGEGADTETINTTMDNETDDESEEESTQSEQDTEDVETEPETEGEEPEMITMERSEFESLIDERIEQATASVTREDRAEEVIANSPEYDEDDRDELMAASDSLFEKIHKQATRAGGATLPRSASARSQVTASAEGEDLIEKYGTGIQE